MKKLLFLLFSLHPFLAFNQNLLDTRFSKKDCALQPPSTFIATFEEGCYLKRWKGIGTSIPKLINYEDQATFYQIIKRRDRHNYTSSAYREYLQALFSEPLEKGIWYKFSAEIKAHKEATSGIYYLDLFFGNKNISEKFTPNQVLRLPNQIKQKSDSPPYYQFDYFNTWDSKEYFYKAEGGETYLIIGSFSDNAPAPINISKKVFNDSTNAFNASYLLRNIKFEKIPPPRKYQNELPQKINAGDNITLNSIEFESGNAIVKKEAYAEIKKLAKLLQANDLKLKIIGHTDNIGTEKDNWILSKNRSKAVATLLNQFGIDSNRMEVTGLGESKPIADNQSAEGRRQNRRVEFIFL